MVIRRSSSILSCYIFSFVSLLFACKPRVEPKNLLSEIANAEFISGQSSWIYDTEDEQKWKQAYWALPKKLRHPSTCGAFADLTEEYEKESKKLTKEQIGLMKNISTATSVAVGTINWEYCKYALIAGLDFGPPVPARPVYSGNEEKFYAWMNAQKAYAQARAQALSEYTAKRGPPLPFGYWGYGPKTGDPNGLGMGGPIFKTDLYAAQRGSVLVVPSLKELRSAVATKNWKIQATMYLNLRPLPSDIKTKPVELTHEKGPLCGGSFRDRAFCWMLSNRAEQPAVSFSCSGILTEPRGSERTLLKPITSSSIDYQRGSDPMVNTSYRATVTIDNAALEAECESDQLYALFHLTPVDAGRRFEIAWIQFSGLEISLIL